jgi:hypothetical protein
MEAGWSEAGATPGTDDEQRLLWELLFRASSAVREAEEPDSVSPRQLVEWLFETHGRPWEAERYRRRLQPKLERFVLGLVAQYAPAD